MENNSKPKLQFALSLIAALVLVLYGYTFLHEIGHGLIGTIAGGRITRLKLGFDARIHIADASYNQVTGPLMNAFGALLPYICCFFMAIFYRKNIKNYLYHIFHFTFSAVVLGSLLAWIFVPFLYAKGSAPVGDDVTRFLTQSGLQFWIVPLGALLLQLLLFYFAFIVKKMHQPYFEITTKLGRRE